MRLSDKIRNHSARVAVIDQGNVGLPLAIEFAKVGFRVTGIDLDEEKVSSLNKGESYIPDVESRTLRHLIEGERYRATMDMSVLAESEAIIICVPTPPIVQQAELIIDARNATRGMTIPENKVIRL